MKTVNAIKPFLRVENKDSMKYGENTNPIGIRKKMLKGLFYCVLGVAVFGADQIPSIFYPHTSIGTVASAPLESKIIQLYKDNARGPIKTLFNKAVKCFDDEKCNVGSRKLGKSDAIVYSKNKKIYVAFKRNIPSVKDLANEGFHLARQKAGNLVMKHNFREYRLNYPMLYEEVASLYAEYIAHNYDKRRSDQRPSSSSEISDDAMVDILLNYLTNTQKKSLFSRSDMDLLSQGILPTSIPNNWKIEIFSRLRSVGLTK